MLTFFVFEMQIHDRTEDITVIHFVLLIIYSVFSLQIFGVLNVAGLATSEGKIQAEKLQWLFLEVIS